MNQAQVDEQDSYDRQKSSLRSRLVLAVCLALAALLYSSCATSDGGRAGGCKPGVFTLEMMPREISSKMPVDSYARTWGDGRPDESIASEPTYPGKPVYAVFHLGKTDIFAVATFAASGKGGVDRLIVDANQNKDLTDDPVLVLTGKGVLEPVKLHLASGKTTLFRIGREPTVRKGDDGEEPCDLYTLQRAEWYRGTVSVNGKICPAIIYDRRGDGLELGRYDQLAVNLDGSNAFAPSMGAGLEIAGGIPLEKLILLGGEVWDVELNASGPTLTLNQTTEPTATLQVTNELGKEWDSASFLVRLYCGKERRGLFYGQGAKCGHRVLAENDVLLVLTATVVEDGRTVRGMGCATKKRISLDKDQAYDFHMKKPDRMVVSLKEKDRNLTVSASVGNDLLSGCRISGRNGGEMPSPKVSVHRVADGEHAEPFACGVMEYG